MASACCKTVAELLAGATREEREQQNKLPDMGAEIGCVNGHQMAKQDTTIVDLVVSRWYFTPGAPVSDVNKTVAKIHVGMETGQSQTSEASC